MSLRFVTDVNGRPVRVQYSDARSRKILEEYLASDAPRPGTGPSTVGRRIGSLAWVVDYNEAGQVESLVVDERPEADARDEQGNCAGCGFPFDSETSHGYPVCQSTVTVIGRGDGDEIPEIEEGTR